MKPALAEGEMPGHHAQNAAPKLPKGKDEYSGHLPQVELSLLITNLFNVFHNTFLISGDF